MNGSDAAAREDGQGADGAGGDGVLHTAESLRYRTVTGELRRGDVTLGEDHDPAGLLAVRSVVVDGRALVQKWVPHELGAHTPRAYDLLDAEVRALSRLAQVFTARFPSGLPVLRGYNVDVDEPFLLVEPVSAPRLSRVLRSLESSQERPRFVSGLLTGLYLCKTAKVTHRGITLDNLRWDGVTVHLTDFEHALLTSAAGAADDVSAAGEVIRQVHLGPRPGQRFGDDPPHLREELRGVFDADPRARPPVEELMSRYRVPVPDVHVVEPAGAFDVGRRQFERVSAIKRGDPPDAPPPPPPPPDRPDGATIPVVSRDDGAGSSTTRWLLVALAVVVLVLLAVFGLPLLLGTP